MGTEGTAALRKVAALITPALHEEFARAFLSGYTQVRPSPTNSARLLEPYLLLRDAFILNFITTAAPVNADVASWGPRRISGIVANMQAYVEGRPYPGTSASEWF